MAKQKVSPWGFVGMGGMACMLFLAWFLPRPRQVPWLPAVAFVVWLPVIVLGTRSLGWGG